MTAAVVTDLIAEAPGGWLVERVRGPAGALHAASVDLLEGPPRRRVRLVEAEQRALVLGSTQPEDHVDRAALAAAGVALARRRSGGSAVLVGPGECAWVDVVVPPDDPLSDADVGRATWWVGDTWRAAVAELAGRSDLTVWRAGLARTSWSDRVCFAGVGPGEVVVGSGPQPGPKVVGVSQRRTRGGALFQTAALLRWNPEAVATLLAGPDGWRHDMAVGLARAACGIAGTTTDALGLAFVHHLPDT